MALVKVTALKFVTIIDPFPMEGVGRVTIQLKPGQYQAYQMYDHQADRLRALLDSAQNALMLTYEIEFDDTCIYTKRYAMVSFIDVVPGQRVLLGAVPAGMAIEEAVIKIVTPFDGATAMSIGDTLINARIMKVTDNKPAIIGQYKLDVDYRYLTDTSIYVYFPTGTPTQGVAEIFVYLA